VEKEEHAGLTPVHSEDAMRRRTTKYPGRRAHADEDIRSGLPCGDRDRCDGRRILSSSSDSLLRNCITFLLMMCLLFINACSRVHTGPDARFQPPARTASLEELVDHINRSGNQPKAIKGTLVMGFQARPDLPVRHCSGHMLLSADREIYLKGHASLLPTIFTLVSNGREFWLHVPRDKTVYTGLMEAAYGKNREFGIDLNLRDLFRALLPCPVEDDRLVELEREDPYYVLSIFSGAEKDRKLSRRLWVEKDRYRIEKEKYYNAEGSEDIEIRRADFLESGCCFFPRDITVRNGVSGKTLTLSFNQVAINPEGLESSLFHFDLPEGVVKKVIQ
jgi:hypothetical protein